MTEKAKTRFWEKVYKTEDCWLWTAAKFDNGYGAQTINRKTLKAHRISWRIHNGPIPRGLCVLHKCDVPACVNPGHLFLGTPADNAKDRDRKGRQSRGIKHYKSKLTREEVREIRHKYIPIIYSTTKLAEEYGVSNDTIHKIVKRKSWKHI